MKRSIDCEAFQDQLEGLQRGSLAEEVAAELRRHASSCSDCAMLLELQERLAVPGRAELEAAVPDKYVASMWERVQSDIAAREARPGWRTGDRRASRWLVPALAAASLFLLLATGLLLSEVKGLRAREQALVQRVADHERWLAELDLRTRADPVARTAGLAGSQAWERLLSRRESVSIAELEALLAGLPARATVLNTAEWQAVKGSVPAWMGSVWGNATQAIRADDGVQAAELLDLLIALDLEPDRSVSTARILALKRAAGPGRL